VLEKLVRESRFPWMLSNLLDVETNKPLVANTFTKLVVESNGIKVGIIALAEKDWVVSLASVDFDSILYESYVETARKLTHELKTVDVNFFFF
jgi:5'-nucleotidase